MFGLTVSHRFYLYNQPTDMRKSFDGLCGLVQNELSENPTHGSVYVFINKFRDKIKLLHWQPGGFVLYYKRLETGRFELPDYDTSVKSLDLNYSQLVLLIDGISITNIQQKKRYDLVSKTT